MDPTTDISAYGCFKRAAYARKDSGHRGTEQLLYALLELRYSIERYLFETLDLLHQSGLSPRKRAKVGEWGARGLKNAILKIDPDFVMKLHFINLCFKADPTSRPASRLSGDLPIPDLQYLNGLYGRIGNYLHAHQCNGSIIMNVGSWEAIETLVTEGVACMERLVHTTYACMALNDNGVRLFEEFKSGRLSAEETIVQLAHQSR